MPEAVLRMLLLVLLLAGRSCSCLPGPGPVTAMPRCCRCFHVPRPTPRREPCSAEGSLMLLTLLLVLAAAGPLSCSCLLGPERYRCCFHVSSPSPGLEPCCAICGAWGLAPVAHAVVAGLQRAGRA
jgi:hypothetical protein